MYKVFFLLLLLTSCSFIDETIFDSPAESEFSESFKPVGGKKIASLKKSKKISKNEKKSPLSIEVAQAFFDQDKLNVKVLLTTNTEIDPADIVVGITGLKDGELAEESYKKVSEIVASDLLDSGTKLAIRFELATKELTEYQIRCSWGKEARDLWASISNNATKTETRAALQNPASIDQLIKTPALSGKLELTDIDIQSEELQCVIDPCDLSYTIIGKFFNGKAEAVLKTQLAVGLYWANDGQVPELPKLEDRVSENEELVDVALGLNSGETATLRIKLDRSVPQVPGGSFIPHVRLITAQ